MIPGRRPPSDDQSQLNVLVPGIMGIGFLISVFMLASDAVIKVLPMVGRRRAAEVTRLAVGRTNDLQSIWDGSPPEIGVVMRRQRSRLVSMLLALSAFGGAVLALRVGFDVASDTGSDRQAWSAVLGLIVAVAIAAPGVLWLLSALLGSQAPRWLRWFHQFWPLGVLPDLRRDP